MARRPGISYRAYIATLPTGEMALAVGHMEPDGTAVVDKVDVLTVTGGDQGIDAVYAGMLAQGIAVHDGRKDGPRDTNISVRERAIAGVLEMVRAN